MTYDSPHGGNIRKLAAAAGAPKDAILDFSASVNPLGFPEWLRPLISANVSSLSHYPDPDAMELREAVARAYGVEPASVVAGNGSTEILFAMPRIRNFVKAVIPQPAYADYRQAAAVAGLDIEPAPMREENGFTLDFADLESKLDTDALVFLGAPNNPTGATFDSGALRRLARRHRGSLFVVDESFGGFVDGFDTLTHDRPGNVVVVCSLTKLFALPGLRLGAAVADAKVAERLRELIPPWTVNALAQAAGARAVGDAAYVEMTRRRVKQWRAALTAGLSGVGGLTVFDSVANYLLVRIDRTGMDARGLFETLLKDGIAIRVCGNFEGLDERFFRVAVRTEEENERLIDGLAKAFGGKRRRAKRKRTPAVMFQGVSSHAGKSVLAAALCRILKQDGFDVAPFKSQNMALNSYVTLDGKEIGRAQVTQAQACGLEPDTRMNPILLKPNSDTGAQVVVMGEPVGAMNVKEYFEYKTEAFEIVKEAYDALSAEHGVIVMEGAGSPAEVNLKERDIVNMKMARHAGASALLVGDIDRGGVFASFIGCVETMAEWERKLLAGFVINKFRGDESLLDSAIEYTKRHTGAPTFGVVPYLHDLGLPEEDRAAVNVIGEKEKDAVTVAVVKLKHVSNFTDIDPLAMEPDVRVVVAAKPEDLDGADAVIVPGSKNVISDISILAANGVGDKLRRIARDGSAEIVGVCGGFQALGTTVFDPHGIESARRSIRGLGLLPVETTIERKKTLARVEGTHIDSGLGVSGYEIHHGKTGYQNLAPAVRRADGEVIGVRSENGAVWGTYLHGLFNRDEFRRWFIDRLRERKGAPAKGRVVVRYDLDAALDRLAETVRRNMRIDGIYKLMGLR